MKLGKVDYIEPRDLWPDEARNFTPWLSTEGLELLAETINVEELALVKTEAAVGPFHARPYRGRSHKTSPLRSSSPRVVQLGDSRPNSNSLSRDRHSDPSVRASLARSAFVVP